MAKHGKTVFSGWMLPDMNLTRVSHQSDKAESSRARGALHAHNQAPNKRSSQQGLRK
jgi:hypothetical protein